MASNVIPREQEGASGYASALKRVFDATRQLIAGEWPPESNLRTRPDPFVSPLLAAALNACGAENLLVHHRRDVAVMFVDLRGYTAFTETVEPEEVVAVLREFHRVIGELSLDHGGNVERFAGDSVMIVFNDPEPLPDAGIQAAQMALAVMREVDQLLATHWNHQGYDLRAGVGLARGYATLGAIGCAARRDYGVIGSVVNLASRLSSEAAAGEVLVSQSLVMELESVFVTEDLGERRLKGFPKAVPVFLLRGARPNPRCLSAPSCDVREVPCL